MSASTIARWNAIPLTREHRKRSRSISDSEEDNVSLVSRSPSPAPPDNSPSTAQLIDTASKIDHEVVNLQTRIKSTNIGYAMLTKLGWKEGQGLGVNLSGRPDPIPFSLKQDSLGLGKASQDERMIDATVGQRRELDSERLLRETEEEKQNRENRLAQQAAIQSEISSTLKPFHCALCDKQYSNVAQYDEHTNSYAHHHKQRMRDHQLSQKPKGDEIEKRKEKERKREEKEMRKVAAAAGVKLSTVVPVVTSAVATPADGEGKGFKKGGWATVSGNVPIPTTNSGGNTITTPAASSSNRGAWAAIATPTTPPRQPVQAPPSFKSSGWSTFSDISITGPLEASTAAWVHPSTIANFPTTPSLGRAPSPMDYEMTDPLAPPDYPPQNQPEPPSPPPPPPDYPPENQPEPPSPPPPPNYPPQNQQPPPPTQSPPPSPPPPPSHPVPSNPPPPSTSNRNSPLQHTAEWRSPYPTQSSTSSPSWRSHGAPSPSPHTQREFSSGRNDALHYRTLEERVDDTSRNGAHSPYRQASPSGYTNRRDGYRR